MIAALRWIAAAFFVLAALPLAAHELRPSVVELREVAPNEYSMDWKVTLTAGSGAKLANQLEPIFPQNCTMQSDPIQRLQSAALMGRVNLACEGSPAGGQFGLNELLGKSDAIARFVPLEATPQSFRLTADKPTATILAEPNRLSVLNDYFIIGGKHIVFGWDHLLFVIALVLLVQAPWPVIKAATAFTIAHSITLAATILGYSGLPGRPVEALIALSIVFLAVEVLIVLRKPERKTLTRRYPWAVAFAFGLVHGFGFAGALADIGLPQAQLATALLAFNLGVEAGQLIIIAMTLALLKLLSRLPTIQQTQMLKLATYGIGAVGSYWLIERVIG